MGLFDNNHKTNHIPLGIDWEKEYLKDDIVLLLDVVIMGRKLTNKEISILVSRHNDIITKKMSINKIRELVGLEPITGDECE